MGSEVKLCFGTLLGMNLGINNYENSSDKLTSYRIYFLLMSFSLNKNFNNLLCFTLRDVLVFI